MNFLWVKFYIFWIQKEGDDLEQKILRNLLKLYDKRLQ